MHRQRRHMRGIERQTFDFYAFVNPPSLRRALWGVALVNLMACGSDAMAPRNEQDALLWVAIDKQAVTLSTEAPYRTIKLSATAYRGTGAVIEEVTPIFSSSDDNITVTNDGLVTAVRADVQPSLVVASVQYNGITRLDSAYILVTNAVNPAPFQTLTMSVPRVDAGVGNKIPIVVQDANGATLSVPVAYESSDISIATVDTTGFVTGLVPDKPVTITAVSTVYGVTRRDSIRVTIGYPEMMTIALAERMGLSGEKTYVFALSDIYVSAGGRVIFMNSFTLAQPNFLFKIDIRFDDPSVAIEGPPPFPTGNGNISEFGATSLEDVFSMFQQRVFTRPGTYTFYSDRLKSGGRIHVR